MTRDEQALITEFITHAVTGDPGQPPPPIDPEADAIIRALFVRNPTAAYRVTLLAIAQARALQATQMQLSAPPRQGFLQRFFGGPPRQGYVPPPTYGQPYPVAPGGFGASLGQGLALGAGVAIGEDLVRDVFSAFDGPQADQGGFDNSGNDFI